MELERKLVSAFKEYGMYPEIYIEGPNEIIVDIIWGDWKHDHLLADNIIENFFKNQKEYKLLSLTKVITDEDGSDTYSAQHIIKFIKKENNEDDNLLEDAEDDEIAELQNKIAALQQQKTARLQKEKEAEDKINQIKETSIYKDIQKILDDEDDDLSTEDKLSELFYLLVPDSGSADTVVGEVVRALNRIYYRYENDGDLFYQGYGLDTCGSPLAYILDKVDENNNIYDLVKETAEDTLKGRDYEIFLGNLTYEVLKSIRNNLIDLLKPTNDDMYDWDDDVIRDLEPKYDDYYEVPDVACRLHDMDIIDIEDEFRDWEEFKGCDIEYDSRTGQVYISNMDDQTYDATKHSWRHWMRTWADQLVDEYGDPDDLEDLDESLNNILNESAFNDEDINKIETLKNLLSRDGTQATLTHKGIIKFSSPDFKESISIDLNTLEDADLWLMIVDEDDK